MAVNAGAVSPATYDLIGTWVGQQRQAPAPLTEKLRSALLILEDILKSESLSQAEPEVEDFNWIGLLQEYRAARPFKGSRDIIFTESAVDTSGRGQQIRFKCEVTLGEAPGMNFPIVDAADQPTFARKKDAKKYAAKCAIQWLRAGGFMPQNGGNKFPKVMSPPAPPQSPPQKKQKQQQSPIQQRQQVSRNPFTPNKNMNSAKVPTSPFDDSQPSARAQVAELCVALGFPAPIYRTAPEHSDGNSSNAGFFSGWADFGDYAPLLPFKAAALTRVNDKLGERAARELVAERLLELLRVEKRRRDAADAAFLAQYATSAAGDTA